MSDAAAHATVSLAQSADVLNGVRTMGGATASEQEGLQMTTPEQPTPRAVTSAG